MKNTARIFTLLVMVISNSLSAQDIYLCGSDSSENINDIYQLNADNSLTLVIPVETVPTLLDIAKSPSGTFYGISLNALYRVENNGVLTLLSTLPAGAYNSLVCSNDNELFTINGETGKLYKYNIAANTVELVFNLGFGTPGDITFYKGNLIIPTMDAKLKAYNPENNSVVTIHCFPPDFIDVFGITTTYDSCDNGEIFFCMFFSGVVYKLNIDTNEATVLNLPITKNWRGMASDSDYMFSECAFQFESIDCNLSLPGNMANQTIVFPNPANEIIYIRNGNDCDLQFFDLHGRLIKSVSDATQADISNLESGVYFLKILSGNDIAVKKILKE